jgi:hypothetical protein
MQIFSAFNLDRLVTFCGCNKGGGSPSAPAQPLEARQALLATAVATGPLVKPTYGPAATFPISIRIPIQVALELGVPRVVAIQSAEQELPEALVAWFKNDLRYRGWFV